MPLLTTADNRLPRTTKWDLAFHELLRGAGLVLLVKVLGTGFAFGFNLLLARGLGADGAGVFQLAMTVVMIGIVFGKLGLETTVVRWTADAATRSEWPRIAALHRKSLRVTLVAAGSVAAAVFVAAPVLAGHVFHEPELVAPLRLMAPAIVVGSLLLVIAAALRGLHEILSSAILETVAVPLLSLLPLAPLSRLLGVTGAALCHLTAASLALAVGYGLWRQATPRMNRTAPIDTWPLLQRSLPVLWIGGMDLVLAYGGTILLGIWEDTATVAVFNVASRTALLTSFVLTAINGLVTPKFAALHAAGQRLALERLARRTALLATLLSLPLLLLFLFAPGTILRLFGGDFLAGESLLRWLAAGQFVNAATGSVGCLLLMSGHERLMRNNMICMAALSLALNVLLIPAWGALGAAVATTVCVAATNVVSVVLAHRTLSILTLPLPTTRFRS